jgi:hypothetical protein
MAQYKNFYDAWVAKQSQPTPAQTSWTPQNLQNLTNAYIGQGNAPTQQMIQGGYAPPAPKFDPMGDVSYAGISSAQTNAEQHAGTEHDYQYARGEQLYGIDPSGAVNNLNPYAQAAILKRNYDNSVRGTDNSYAASGQLYAGSRVNAQAANDFGYGASMDQLKRTASDFYHGQDLNVQGVKDQGLFTLAQALGPAFAAFLAQQRGS